MDKLKAIQFQSLAYRPAIAPAGDGGAKAYGVERQPKVAGGEFGAQAYANISAIDGELHPESRNEIMGQKLYLLA